MEVSLKTKDKTKVEEWKEGENLYVHPYIIAIPREPAL